MTRSPEKRRIFEEAGADAVVADALDASGLEKAANIVGRSGATQTRPIGDLLVNTFVVSDLKNSSVSL